MTNKNKPIYLDYNASTPIDPMVVTEMLPYLTEFYGNPSSAHWYGIQLKKAVENARNQVASILGCSTEEIVFTSGGSEANNCAIKGIAISRSNKGNHIITTQIEHPATLETCRYLDGEGFDVTYLPVDEYGLINPEEVKDAIRPSTILITLMHANNEVGTIQPIAKISQIARKNNVIIHVDAAQSVAKISTDVNQLGVDLLTLAGHKLYAPIGAGALFIRKGIRLPSLIHGGGHENGRRAGTENVSQIVGLGKACEIGYKNLSSNQDYMMSMRERLYEKLGKFKDVRLIGHPTRRLPNTLNLSFKGVDSINLLIELSEKVALSTGSACHSGKTEISSVLKAMKVPIEWAQGAIRFSVGRMTTVNEIDRAVEFVEEALHK